MKCQFGYLSWWSRRNRIVGNMPADYKKSLPETTGCTKLKHRNQASLKLWVSVSRSMFKSSPTLKITDSSWSAMNFDVQCVCLYSGTGQYQKMKSAGEKSLQIPRKGKGFHSWGRGSYGWQGVVNQRWFRHTCMKINISPFAASETIACSSSTAIQPCSSTQNPFTSYKQNKELSVGW